MTGANARVHKKYIYEQYKRGSRGNQKRRESTGGTRAGLELHWSDRSTETSLVFSKRIPYLQAPGPGHENPGESDETPQASSNTEAKWRVRGKHM